MYKRQALISTLKYLKSNAAVALLGPRQAGKTTLALEVAKEVPSVYLDLENPEDSAKLKNPSAYFALHADKLVILDEVQRMPNLFMVLRGVIDERRRQGRNNYQFLILGSASHDLLHQSSESLAGRITYLELFGLNLFEVSAQEEKQQHMLWCRGGFPRSYMADSDDESAHWRYDFIRTYLERDIPQLGPRIPAETLHRFWTMLAHSQGEAFNASTIASSLGVSSVTVGRYLDLMVDLLLVRKLSPWFGNTKKRLIKAPRVYIRDTGLLHQLLHIPHYEHLLSHPILGKSWEGFVIEQIISVLPRKANTFFYRSAGGAEIDFVIEIEYGVFWAIEIKHNSIPAVKKGFYSACEDIQPVKKFVVYSGEEAYPLAKDITAISLPLLMEELQSQ